MVMVLCLIAVSIGFTFGVIGEKLVQRKENEIQADMNYLAGYEEGCRMSWGRSIHTGYNETPTP